MDKNWGLNAPDRVWTAADINKERSSKVKKYEKPEDRRAALERRIEFLEESLVAERKKRKRGRETAAEKRIKKSILDNKETLKNL